MNAANTVGQYRLFPSLHQLIIVETRSMVKRKHEYQIESEIFIMSYFALINRLSNIDRKIIEGAICNCI